MLLLQVLAVCEHVAKKADTSQCEFDFVHKPAMSS